MGYEFDEVSKNYFAHTAKLAEWITALTISEIAFVLTQKYIEIDIFFYCFTFFSLLSIIIAIMVMFAIAIVEDAKLHGVLVLLNKKSIPSKEEFNKSFDIRMGRFGLWFVELITKFKAYQWLVISFFIGSIIMIFSLYNSIR